MNFPPQIQAAIDNAAQQTGIDPRVLGSFVSIESGGRPDASTGSYHGLLQLSNGEFQKYGGQNIYDPQQNLLAGAQKIRDEATAFNQKFGRDPTPGELYLIHQQGAAGSAAHFANPDGTAWENIARYYPNEAIAKKAIWGNVPDDMKAKFGSVDNVTSGQFAQLWNDKVAHFGGGDAPLMPKYGPDGLNEVKGDKPNPLNLLSPQSIANAHPASSGPNEVGADGLQPLSLMPEWMREHPAPAYGGYDVASAAAPSGGLLSGLFNGGNPTAQSVASTMAIPKAPAIQPAGNLARPVDISKLIAIAQARQNLGTA